MTENLYLGIFSVSSDSAGGLSTTLDSLDFGPTLSLVFSFFAGASIFASAIYIKLHDDSTPQPRFA